MPQSPSVNRQITLKSRPEGAPNESNFELVHAEVPTPAEGELLLRTVYLSLDPYMRGRLSDAKSYADPVPLGGTVVGATVSRVESSRHPDYQAGDWVLAGSGWQDHALSDGTGLLKLDPEAAPPSYALGILGMPGFTAYTGLLDIGQPEPGETVVVAAATGAVGANVAQIAKLKGCRAVGIAGGEEKCRYAVDELGMDACIDHHADDFADRLAEACPDGIDVYFENVGGKVFQTVLPLLNLRARIPVCGLIAHYNATGLPEGPDLTPVLMRHVLTKRLTIKGFLIFDEYERRYEDFARDMAAWVAAGDIRYREQVVEGLEQAPDAFAGLLEGRNFGKLVIRVGEDEG